MHVYNEIKTVLIIFPSKIRRTHSTVWPMELEGGKLARICQYCNVVTCRFRVLKALSGACVQIPSLTNEWIAVAEDFMRMWNMPNCLGAIDGKLVHIQRPVKCGGQYFNYKRSFSVNMMAVVDAKYRFLYVAVGAQGSANDASVFSESKFGEALYKSTNPLSLPSAKVLPSTDIETPMFFVADEAYPLKTFLMKPFSARGLSASERIFNYRLSRARRVVENSFGILTNRFRILRGQMQLQPDTACLVVLACCALHNFLRSNSCANAEYEDDSSEDKVQGSTIDSVRHEPRLTGAGYNSQAKAIRDTLASYFVGPGQISYQWKHANVKCD